MESNKGISTNGNYVMISQLNHSKHNVKIKVLVQRLWNIPKLGRAIGPGLDMILMDEKGAQIHASVHPNNVITFENELRENKIISLDNFTVERKDLSFCPLNNPYKIKFKYNSVVCRLNDQTLFPPPSFSFTRFDQLYEKIDKTTPLTDVIGLFHQLDAITVMKTKKGEFEKRDLHILNESGDSLRICFWGDVIEQLESIDPTSTNKPTVIVTSTTVRKYNNKVILHASYATKIFLNMDVSEAISLKSKDIKPNLKRSSPEKNTHLCDISDLIANSSQPLVVFCEATISSVYDNRGFYYNACSSCPKAVANKDSTYWCFQCEQTVDDPRIRMKIQFQIDDGTSSKDMTAFDEQAVYILGESFDNMLSLSYQGNGEVLVQNVFKKMLGKKFDFEIRITSFALAHPDAPLTVGSVFEVKEIDQDNQTSHPNASSNAMIPLESPECVYKKKINQLSHSSASSKAVIDPLESPERVYKKKKVF